MLACGGDDPLALSCEKHGQARRVAEIAAFVVILAVAAVLRLRGIGAESLWADEGLTARIVRMPLGEMLHFIRIFEQTPPAYYLVLKPWVMFFGDSEAVLRLPSAIFGVASAAMLYVLVRRAFGATAGLVAAGLLALSPFHIAYSQEARAYSLFVLLSIVSCDLFVRLLERRSARLEVLYIVASTLMLYTHLYGIFTIAAQHVAYLVGRVAQPPSAVLGQDTAEGGCATYLTARRWILVTLAIAALYSPWVIVIRQWLRIVNTYFWVKPLTLDEISHAFELYCGSVALLAALLALAVIGVWRSRDRARVVLFVGLMLLPVVVPVAVSVLTKPTFSPRYGLVAAAGLYALAAAGVTIFTRPVVRAIVIAVLFILNLLPTALPDPKPQWREAGRYLDQHLRAGDYATVNRKGATNMYDFYVHRPDVRRIGFDGWALPVTQPLDPGKHIWLVLYTCDFPMRAMVQRGNWRVMSQKAFRDVLILELADPL